MKEEVKQIETLGQAGRICIVSHNGYGAISGAREGFIGGVEWQTALLARWLASRGHSVSLVTWDEGGPVEETIDGVRIVKICKQKAGLPGIRFFYPKWSGLLAALRTADAEAYYHNCGECVTGQIALWCRRNHRRSSADEMINARRGMIKTRDVFARNRPHLGGFQGR